MRRVVAAPSPAPVACWAVHNASNTKPACERCRRAFSVLELREYDDACNGHTRCALGRHVPRICETCGFLEQAEEFGLRDEELVGEPATPEQKANWRTRAAETTTTRKETK